MTRDETFSGPPSGLAAEGRDKMDTLDRLRRCYLAPAFRCLTVDSPPIHHPFSMANIPIERKRESSLLWPLLALLGLVILGILLMRGCSRPGTSAATVPDSTATAAAPTVTGGLWDADFGLSETANGLIVRGKVPTEAAKAALLDQIKGVYPQATIVDSLTVDAAAPTAPFLEKAGSLIGYLAQLRNAGLGVNAQNVTVRGEVRSQSALDAVKASLTGALPAGYALMSEIDVVAASEEVASADSLIAAALIQPIPFATGTATLGDGASAILDKVAEALKQFPSVKVAVEGHTDNTGNAATNQALSQQRAEAAMKYLVDKGVAAARLTAIGYGQTRPIGDNATEAGRAMNRRVVFATN